MHRIQLESEADERKRQDEIRIKQLNEKLYVDVWMILYVYSKSNKKLKLPSRYISMLWFINLAWETEKSRLCIRILGLSRLLQI